jgi:hypothetical protein
MALSASCSGERAPKLGRFMNTTPDIADMIEIIERHGEWREHEVDSLLFDESTLSESMKKAIKEATRWNKGQEMLQYWGFSYGSVTGATFATMQPGRVKRLIVDGICDARASYKGLWTTSLLDSDRVMDRFFEDCYKADPDRCSFYTESGPSSMRYDLESILQVLNNTPLAVPGSDSHGPDVITYSDVMRLIEDTLYDPLVRFPRLSNLLTDVSRGNGSEFASFRAKGQASACPYQPPGDPHQIRDCPPYTETILETSVSIDCTDGEDLSVLPRKDFEDYHATLREQSKWMGDYWASWTLSCWGWKTRPKWRYDGNDSALHFSYPC